MESLACGTPVVAFDIGGNGDMITHKHNGYLAPLANDSNTLGEGIEWILSQDAKAYATLAHNARVSSLRFESAKIAHTYINTYVFLTGGGSNHRFLLTLCHLHSNFPSTFNHSNNTHTRLVA